MHWFLRLQFVHIWVLHRKCIGFFGFGPRERWLCYKRQWPRERWPFPVGARKTWELFLISRVIPCSISALANLPRFCGSKIDQEGDSSSILALYSNSPLSCHDLALSRIRPWGWFLCRYSDSPLSCQEGFSRPNSGYSHARAWRALLLACTSMECITNLKKSAYLRARAWRLLHILRHSILQILILLSSFESTPNYNCVLSSVCGGE